VASQETYKGYTIRARRIPVESDQVGKVFITGDWEVWKHGELATEDLFGSPNKAKEWIGQQPYFVQGT